MSLAERTLAQSPLVAGARSMRPSDRNDRITSPSYGLPIVVHGLGDSAA